MLCAKLTEVKPTTQSPTTTAKYPVKNVTEDASKKVTDSKHEDKIMFIDETLIETTDLASTTEGDAEATTIENRNIFDAPKRDKTCGGKMRKDSAGRCRQVL